jgi:hypothetical protein
MYSTHGAKKKYILILKLEEKRPFGRFRHGWQGDMKIGIIKETGCELDSTGSQ